MPTLSTIGIFVAAAAVLVVIPGPNTIYIATRSLQQGASAGVMSCLGVMVGTLLHVSAAALGLSALMLTSAVAFNVVKYAGAAYLVYLGVRSLLVRDDESDEATPRPEMSLFATFRQGVTVNVLNPKTALFIGAFLPQFVDPTRGAPAGQIVVLGAVLVAVGGVSDLAYALLAGRVGGWLRGAPRMRRAQHYLAGAVYIGLGAAAALLGTRHS